MSRRGSFVAAACLLLFASMCVWLLFERGRLLSEKQALTGAAQSQLDRDTNAAELQQRAQTDEAERIRQEHAELLRLRAEVAQLRRQISEVRLATNKNNTPKVDPSTPEDSARALEHYESNLQVSVPWQQTLVTGGWQLPSGKHGLFFMQPRRVNPAGDEEYDPAVPGQITLDAWIAEIPEDVLSHSELASLKTYTATDSRHALLSVEQAQGVMKVLEQTTGVDILHTPKITTLDGRRAQIAIGRSEPAAFVGPQPGPTLEFTPIALPGGAGVELKLSANLWLSKLKQ